MNESKFDQRSQDSNNETFCVEPMFKMILYDRYTKQRVEVYVNEALNSKIHS